VLKGLKRCPCRIAKNAGSRSRKIGDRQLQILGESEVTVSAADATHWRAILLSILKTLLAVPDLAPQIAPTWVLNQYNNGTL
jgi:hypothetical protein